MAGNILTPSAIWNDFYIGDQPVFEILSEKKDGDILFSRVKIDGRKVNGEKVQIFGVLAKGAHVSKVPAILLAEDFVSGTDEKLIKALVKRGYAVLSVDLAGVADGKEDFTHYPSAISYSNYEQVKGKLYEVSGETTGTCWYEWACVLRYALKYLAEQSFVTKVGVLGIGEAAAVAWQVAGSDPLLTCAVFALNAGWIGYRGIYKFGGMVEPQFSDNMYKFIAGVDPQAYAMHVKCPVLVLSSTNSKLYDVDRAFDTVTRMDNAPFKAVHYSVGYRERVNGEAFQNALIFFEKFLQIGGADKSSLPQEVEIKCELENKMLTIDVTPDDGDVKSVDLYASEETYIPCERSWQKVANVNKDGKIYKFTYAPNPYSGSATFFALVTYSSGFVIGSSVVNKKFTVEEVSKTHKSKILYSSRILGAESIFYPANEKDDNVSAINLSEKKKVKIKKGPMGIEGVGSKSGLLTFKFAAKKDTPPDGAMLMLDVYATQKGVFTVKLITDYFGNKTEYVANVNLLGGEVWQNVKLDLNKFKTAEGMSLRNYGKINALEFDFGGNEFLINNALWV
ncbi:MAG: hypothetical protein IKB30_02210 [Clostridia bacterium]|nr:hypothetical protein [Clostridia bacterium]